MRSKADGFSLIEIIVVVGIISILAGATAPFVVIEMRRARLNDTSERMVRLIDGIVGRPLDGYFGYVGDMGGVPASLQDLVVQGTQPNFAQSIYGFGVGWNGPYVHELGPLGDATRDAWGTAFSYNGIQAQVTSAASDHSLGTGDDLVYPASAPTTTGILTVTVLGIPSGTSTTVPLTSAEASVSVTISNSGSLGTLGTVGLAGGGPFYTATPIHVGIRAVIATGLGTYSGLSATKVIEMYAGNASTTLTLVQP